MTQRTTGGPAPAADGPKGEGTAVAGGKPEQNGPIKQKNHFFLRRPLRPPPGGPRLVF